MSSHLTLAGSASAALDANSAIELNNRGSMLNNEGRYEEAVGLFQRAVELKVSVHGERSVHVCISLSGLADAYLGWGKKDKSKLPLARAEAERMLRIATRIKSPEQIRIAKEILADVAKLDGKGTDVDMDFESSATTKPAVVSSKGPLAASISREPPTKRCYNADCPRPGVTEGLLVCSRCKRAYFCCKECQVAAWPEHKHSCRRAEEPGSAGGSSGTGGA